MNSKGTIYLGDNLAILRKMPGSTIDLIYIDPPFNTGRKQQLKNNSYDDTLGGAYLDFIQERLIEAHRLLTPQGSIYFHIDYREAHYCKILLDQIFGRDNFVNEIIWAYDYGGRSRKRWPSKHDTIFWYAKDPKSYTFNIEAIERIPYMAPGLVGKDKAKKGKIPTDVWWQTIVPTQGNERLGYPTQKPLAILRRIVMASSNPGDTVLDFFAGSGTTGAACLQIDRRFILIDNNPDALRVMARRFAAYSDITWIDFTP